MHSAFAFAYIQPYSWVFCICFSAPFHSCSRATMVLRFPKLDYPFLESWSACSSQSLLTLCGGETTSAWCVNTGHGLANTTSLNQSFGYPRLSLGRPSCLLHCSVSYTCVHNWTCGVIQAPTRAETNTRAGFGWTTFPFVSDPGNCWLRIFAC